MNISSKTQNIHVSHPILNFFWVLLKTLMYLVVLEQTFVIKLDSKCHSRLGKAHKNEILWTLNLKKLEIFKFETQNFRVWRSSFESSRVRVMGSNSKKLDSKKLEIFWVFLIYFISSRVMHWLKSLIKYQTKFYNSWSRIQDQNIISV